LESGSSKTGSSDSDEDIDTNTIRYENIAAASGNQVHIWSRPQDTWRSPWIEDTRSQEVSHVNKDSIPITVFLFFMEVSGGRDIL
jgi:hypothetical protein